MALGRRVAAEFNTGGEHREAAVSRRYGHIAAASRGKEKIETVEF